MMKKKKTKKESSDVVNKGKGEGGNSLGHLAKEDKDGYAATREITLEGEISSIGDSPKREAGNISVEGDPPQRVSTAASVASPLERVHQIVGESQECRKYGESYEEETLLGEGEEEMSDMSTDEMLSGMESDEDVSEEVKQFSSGGELIYKHFYNDEINALSQEIQEKERLLGEVNKTVWVLKNRFVKLEKHIKSKKKEMAKRKKLVEEKKKIEEEENGACVNIQAKNHFLTKQNEKLKYERERNNEKIIRTQNDLMQCDHSIEEMKEKLIDKEKELKEWTLQIDKLQKEEFEVEKFALCQDKEIENMSYKLEKLNLERVEQEKKVNTMKTKNMQLQMELQANIKENEQMEEEKKKLRTKCKCVVDTINNRDQTIFKFEEEFTRYAKKREKLTHSCKAINEHIETQRGKNHLLSDQLKREESNLSKLKREEGKIQEELKKAYDERDILIKDLDCEKITAREKLEEKNNLQVSLTGLEKTLHKLTQSFEESKREYAKEELNSVEKNQLIKSSEQILTEQNGKLAKLSSKIKVLDEEKFKLQENLQKSKNEYTILEADMVGTQIKIKQMKSNIKKMEQELERQKEILYKFDFQTQVLTKKLNVASGISTFEKKKKSQKKIDTLEKEFTRYEEIYNTLNNEMKRISVELKNIKNQQMCMKEEKGNILQDTEKLELEIKSLESNVLTQNKEKENVMLIEMNLKIELDKMKEIFSNNLDSLNVLKKKKKENVQNEKLSEQDMNAHVDSLKVIVKNMNDELHKLNLQVHDRKSRCNNLELKLDAINVRSGEEEYQQRGEEEGGRPDRPDAQDNQHIHYKIKIEEDISKLKQEIETLDALIEKENQQVEQFQKTLNEIIQTNKSFSENIKCIDPQYKELLKKKNKLNKKCDQIKDDIASIEKHISEYKKKINGVENELNDVISDVRSVEDKVTALQENSRKMEGTINDIFVKIERASNQLRGLVGAKKKPLSSQLGASQSDDDGEDAPTGEATPTGGGAEQRAEQVPLEKRVFKQIQMESLKEKLALLFECFQSHGDNAVVREIYHVIEASE
ncbi:conserved Plasmodium protein, unknown function [Plasmodium vivax]|uniref:Uncharacterized protein n=2 Tax=Plasmodium vivax TaxID=5855 RepID=A0A1G4GT57_PLAVI|nr:hypothetical protein PVMG_01754 [Plasmodium vivax Mauritania I]CAI7718738.1 conserved protein, unknown function [Plasmodium vivax]SCO65785.1 conserved Plasmodium protein, unknown function [Plasmodium vivax]SCO71213.1 conserved Plasmodium protein, unknown function [Plasmodium vivax]VUZ93949.1 conserved protein, unknown function [Plasmodium vivax]